MISITNIHYASLHVKVFVKLNLSVDSSIGEHAAKGVFSIKKCPHAYREYENM